MSSCIHHLHHIICAVSCKFLRMNAVISRTCLDTPTLPPSLSPPVRLRSDRLSLVEECIAQCSTAYKQSTTLLNLASLLRVAGTDTHTHTLYISLLFILSWSDNSDLIPSTHQCEVWGQPLLCKTLHWRWFHSSEAET